MDMDLDTDINMDINMDMDVDNDMDINHTWYLSFFFTLAKFLENKIYTEIYTVDCQFIQ